jgi:hypothetical protein
MSGRNLRSVFAINPGSFPGAHFATWPPALVEPMIKAGTSERGCCPECGASWVRVVERESHFTERPGHPVRYGDTDTKSAKGYGMISIPPPDSTTTGWIPTCTCDAGEPVPATVLDPFSGAGTTGLVADQLGRDAVLIDLNPEYVEMAHERIYGAAPLFVDVKVMV